MKLREVVARYKRLFVKRKYKDILFRLIFRDKEALLQLYNAMNHTSYTNPEELVITTMEDAIYIGMKNDLSFLIANELNLYEHQSTVNKNMPLRGFLYLARMFEGYIESNKLNRYQRKLISLPFPRFVVFYNGEEDMPESFTMRLSEAFGEHEEEPAVECVARFININYGCNQELMDGCKRLRDYSYFVALVRTYLQKGFDKKRAVIQAIEECISQGILEDILRKHRGEVMDMFLTTFDKKMYAEALREEGREEVQEKYEKLSKDHEELAKEHEVLADILSQIIKKKGITYEEVRELAGQVNEDALCDIYDK